jgi:hypothetical protein
MNFTISNTFRLTERTPPVIREIRDHLTSLAMRGKKMSPTGCSRFDGCSANLCPLDPGLSQTVWFSDESICASHQHSKHRWIKKQRSIQRRKTASWLDKPITYQMLYDASRKKKMSLDALEQLAEMRIRRNQNKCISVL